jgi:bacteriocin-like protein
MVLSGNSKGNAHMSNNTELSIEELNTVSGGMSVPTNEAQIIAAIKAKNFANGSIFTGSSSYHDTLDNNPNLPG